MLDAERSCASPLASLERANEAIRTGTLLLKNARAWRQPLVSRQEGLERWRVAKDIVEILTEVGYSCHLSGQHQLRH